MPNTWVTPQATIVSTSTSDTVRCRGRSTGRAAYTPSARTSVRKAAGASLKGGGGLPFLGE